MEEQEPGLDSGLLLMPAQVIFEAESSEIRDQPIYIYIFSKVLSDTFFTFVLFV